MSFTFSEARRSNTHVMVALAGASGTGKTFSAMELATGLSDPGQPFFVIDTEARRALHYADQFNFLHGELDPPFTPQRYREAIDAAIRAGAKVIVIDSMSHEYDGEGGIMDMAENSGAKGPGAWKFPKAEHKKMMNHLLQARCHLIFCLRAEEKLDLTQKDGKGKVIVQSAGWQPICEKRFMYEMTTSVTLNPLTPGRIDMALPHKIQDQHKPIFEPGSLISRKAGEALKSWSEGEVLEVPELVKEGRTHAQQGMDILRAWFEVQIDNDQRAVVKPWLEELKATAKKADKNNQIGNS